jgi:hypothetical protein
MLMFDDETIDILDLGVAFTGTVVLPPFPYVLG